MEVLNIIIDNQIIFITLICIFIINFAVIIYLVLKERSEDKKEIEELLSEIEPLDEKKIEIKQDTELEKNKSEVEEMLAKMQKDLESKPEDVVSTFESEQEENSIISYQELLNSVKQKEEKNVPIKVELDTPVIEIEEKKEYDDERTLLIDVESNVEQSALDKKFKNTDFISPIFGKQDNKIKYPTVPKIHRSTNVSEIEIKKEEVVNNRIEKSIDTSKLADEIRKNDDFLRALKDFRKSLD